jgi:small subunit ribosomal protein S8
MVGDKISQLIISLKNGSQVSKDTVTVSYSKLYESILKVLDDKNFIESFEVDKDKKNISVALKYDENGESAISDVKRVSKLSRRVYKSSKEITPVKNGFGLAVVTTPLGILSDEEAREKNVGGELMFEIW